MAKGVPSVPGQAHARIAARAFLWLLVVCCAACFTIITFMRPTTWYSQNQEFTYIRNNMTLAFPGDVPVATAVTKGKDGNNVVTNVGRDATLWSGSTAFPVTLQWGSVMICVLAVAGLQVLSHSNRAHSSDIGTLPSSDGGVLGKAWRLVRRVGATQLPPYRFWGWWSDGLSVNDALLVMLWFGLTVCYLWYLISRKFDNIGVNLTPPPSPPLPPPLPPSPPVPPPAPTNGTRSPTTTTRVRVVDLMSPLFESQRMEAVAKAFGECLRFNMMVMFLPIARSNFLKDVTGTDFPTLIKYHRWMSWGTLLINYVHSVLYMIIWGAEAEFTTELTWETTHGQRNVCGLVATIFSIVLAFTATSWFRANFWHVFYRVHLFSAAVFIIFSFLHYKSLINWVMPGLIMYAIDRAGYRLWQLVRNWTHVGPWDAHIDGNTLTLRLALHTAKQHEVTPGQTMYVRCPSISLFESHPFSVADVVDSGAGVAHAVVHLRAQGRWTRKLVSMLEQGKAVRMQVEGPYKTQVDSYTPSSPFVIMVAGGIGVTPLLGLLRHYLRLLAQGSSAVPRVHLIWTSRYLAELKLLGSDLFEASAATNATPATTKAPASTPSNKTWLQTSLYYTGFEQEVESSSVKLTPATSSDHRHSPRSSEDALDALGGADKAAAAANAGAGAGGAWKPCVPLRSSPVYNPLVYALTTLVGFFGAWAGLLAAAYYEGYYSRTTAEGADYLTVAVLELLFMLLGAAIPTLAVLAAADWRLRRNVTAAHTHAPDAQLTSMASSGSDDMHGGKLAAAANGAATAGMSSWMTGSAGAALQVLTGYVLAPVSASHAVAASVARPLARGRPDVEALIGALAAQQAGCLDEVDVLVAGSDSMTQQVVELCAAHNVRRAAGVPLLRAKRMAFHH